jgi:hypothetical protein
MLHEKILEAIKEPPLILGTSGHIGNVDEFLGKQWTMSGEIAYLAGHEVPIITCFYQSHSQTSENSKRGLNFESMSYNGHYVDLRGIDSIGKWMYFVSDVQHKWSTMVLGEAYDSGVYSTDPEIETISVSGPLELPSCGLEDIAKANAVNVFKRGN